MGLLETNINLNNKRFKLLNYPYKKLVFIRITIFFDFFEDY